MNNINRFSYFRNYIEIIDEFETEEDKKDFNYAIINFIFKDEIPTFTGAKKIAWLGIINSLEASKIKSFNKQTKTKTKKTQIKIKEKSKKNQSEFKNKSKPKRHSSTSTSIYYIISNNILEKREYEGEKPFVNELDKLFNEYIELRVKNKMSVSDTVLTRLFNKLKPFDEDIKKQMLGNAINGTWKDLYEIKKQQDFNEQKKKTALDKIDELE